MTKTIMAATGLVSAIAVAGAVGLLIHTGGGTRKVVKKASKAMHDAGEKMQDVAHSMLKR